MKVNIQPSLLREFSRRFSLAPKKPVATTSSKLFDIGSWPPRLSWWICFVPQHPAVLEFWDPGLIANPSKLEWPFCVSELSERRFNRVWILALRPFCVSRETYGCASVDEGRKEKRGKTRADELRGGV